MEILKLQRPVVTNGSYNDVLIYNEDGSVHTLLPLKKKVIKQLFGDEYKVYVFGTIDDVGMLHIDGVMDAETAQGMDW